MESNKKTATKPKKVYIKTFGCQMNEHDSQKLLHILSGDYVETETPDEADLLLINTCSVREKPEHKLYSLLGKYADLKRTNRNVLIGVGGCVAQQEGYQIIARNRAVDFVFGTHNISLVPSLIRKRQEGFGRQVAVDYRDEWEEFPLGFGSKDTKASVYIAISRGCNKNCTYCIVPTTRGSEVSRAPEEIVREAKIASIRGTKEVILLGQTVNSYGRDLTPRFSFIELIERISKIDGIERIRFTSPHPQEVRSDFIHMFKENRKVCRHIHMPLQSGSNRILKLMNRNYRIDKYLQIIEELRNSIPNIAITTDIIVGFPGETEKDFRETLEVMKYCKFDNSYSFIFSPRPGTPAADMPDPVPRKEKLNRLYELQSLQQELTTKSLNAFIGSQKKVLVEELTNGEEAKGRISQNFVTHVALDSAQVKVGQIIDVEITGKFKHTLKAKILNKNTYMPEKLQKRTVLC